VDSYYATYLHRAADPAGRAAWIDAFQAGLSETDVAQAFLTSAEYVAEHPDAAALVDGLYADVLGHAGDPDGRQGWLAAVGQGLNPAALAQGFLTSPEAYRRALDRSYTDFLGRPADDPGAQSWLEGLVSGRSRPDGVAEAILASEEYFTRLGGGVS
jgi:hypothetical protein